MRGQGHALMASLRRLIFIQHLVLVSLPVGSGLSLFFAASGFFVTPHQLDYHGLSALLLSHSSRLQHHLYMRHRMVLSKNLSSINF
jgi:hypothetical protein